MPSSRLGVALAVLATLLLIPLAALWFLSAQTVLNWVEQPKAVGRATLVKVRAENPHGVRLLRVTIEQKGKRVTMAEESQPANRFAFRKGNPFRELTAVVGRDRFPELQEGQARLEVESVANDFRGASNRLTLDIQVILKPPALAVDTAAFPVFRGGSGMALFTPVGSWTQAGVRVGDREFPSFPKPGSDNERFALFAVPIDAPDDAAPVVFARNAAGMEATQPVPGKVARAKNRRRDFKINDRFLEKVVNELDPGGTGSLADRYLKINREMRQANNAVLEKLAAQTSPKPRWTERFERWPGAATESEFADVRSYIYDGRKIDEQVHLGVDLASTKQAPVTAAGDGAVVLAAKLGIYGNCVVIDHGAALQSIYAHLSELQVKAGDEVRRGQAIGRSGNTGLAGGDHLHFSVQVGGVQVSPFEWWNATWPKKTIFSRLGLAN